MGSRVRRDMKTHKNYNIYKILLNNDFICTLSQSDKEQEKLFKHLIGSWLFKILQCFPSHRHVHFTEFSCQMRVNCSSMRFNIY